MKFVKKLSFLTAVLLTAVFVLPCFPAKAAYKTPFDVNSKYVYMVNMDTNSVIYEKNADQKAYPASLTKIMTAILAMEQVKDLKDTMVTAPGYIYDEFYGLGVSTADIRKGETVSMEDLLYALILPSACEAGSIIADYLGNGDISEFVRMMNDKAAELGAVNTHFVNPHGLYDTEQVTTAKDMYLITKYALTFPIFEKICNTTTYKMPVTSYHPNDNWYINHTNKMLFKGSPSYYEGMKGIKTGTLDEAGRNLISTASNKNGYNYMLVTMNAPIYGSDGKMLAENLSYTDAKNLYNWAFSSFSVQSVLKENDIVTEIKVGLSSQQDYVNLVAKNDVAALLPVDTDNSVIQRSITLVSDVKAPVKKGDVLGKMELKLSGESIATVELCAMEDVNRSTWMYVLDVTSRFFSFKAVRTLLILLLILLILYLVFLARYRKMKRLRAQRARKYRR